jgi:DNA-binding transcriptional regulator YiaG
MNKNKKIETFIYEGLGFPIKLINAPMRKVYGEWVFDFSMGIFQKAVLNMLTRKPSPLTGKELRFIIDYFEMSYRDFAKIFGVSHVAVVKWEKKNVRMSPSTEIYLRLYILNYLKVTDREFRKLYMDFNPEFLSIHASDNLPLEINAEKLAG